ncbi:hypothetical protein, partial [Streptococcus pneumoniae]
SSKKHPLGEKRNHPGSKLRQGFWMVFRLGVNNWGVISSRIYGARDYGVFLMRKEWRHSRDSLRELRVLNY